MRVQIVGPWPVSYISEACARALQELGHEARTIYYGPEYRKDAPLLPLLLHAARRYRPYLVPLLEAASVWQANRSLLANVQRWRPSLLLILKGEVFLPRVLARIKGKYGAILVNWSFDDPFRYDRLTTGFDLYDHFFCFDSFYVSRLLEEGVTASYLPLAYDPQVCHRMALDEDDRRRFASPVSFVGAMFRSRRHLFRNLADFDMAIWGAGWEALPQDSVLRGKLRGEAWGTEMVKIYNASKIVLNCNHYQSVFGTNSRTFEILGCGAFELTDMKKDVEGLFEAGKEIACYENGDQLAELARYYLDHDREREEIARRGHERARKEHTYLERMKTMMSVAFS